MKMLTIASLLAFVAALAHAPGAQAGYFYPGKALTLADGRTVIPGGYDNGSGFGYTWAVVRLDANGAFDASFGGGAVTIPIFHNYEFATQVAVQPDGRIVVVGSVEDPVVHGCYVDCGTMTAVARLDANGSLDRTFNGTGHVVVSLGGAEELPVLPDIAYLKRFELGADGRITLYGYPNTPAARINPDGTIDPTLPTELRPYEYHPDKLVAIEAYNADLDHYFMTWQADEIEALSSGVSLRGWAPTGKRFKVYATPRAGTSPVCRYYIPPKFGDSHFFGRGERECAETAAAHPEFVLESAAFLHVALPDNGACPANMSPVYRLFNNRLDANHRYTTDRAVRDAMIDQGWIAEGDGPDRVAMCVPA